MNATIIADSITVAGSSGTQIKDWLPAVVSIIVVILGAIATYYVNIKIETNKRQFELKKEVYFKGLDLVSETELIFSRAHLLLDKSKIDPIPTEHPFDYLERVKAALNSTESLELEELDKKYRLNVILMYIQSNKIDVVGNRAVKELFNGIINNVIGSANSPSFEAYLKDLPEFEKKIEELSREVKKDLASAKSW